MTTGKWFLAITAVLAFGVIAPVTEGNGATLLFTVSLLALAAHNPLTNKK